MTDLRESAPHPASGLRAMVEDDGDSVWLYLVEGTSRAIQADCWLYNRRPVEPAALETWPRDRPPPAPAEEVSAEAHLLTPLPDTVDFTWSRDGRSVAVRIGGIVLGYIAAGERRGYSRYLRTTGGWGAPFDTVRYTRLFEDSP